MTRIRALLFVPVLMIVSGMSHSQDRPQGSSAHMTDRAAVERTFDRNKGSLYALYGRALRDKPDLKGRLVFQIDIGAEGFVTRCLVKSSELHDPELEAQLCARIKLIQFEPLEAPLSITKPVEFFPA